MRTYPYGNVPCFIVKLKGSSQVTLEECERDKYRMFGASWYINLYGLFNAKFCLYMWGLCTYMDVRIFE